MSQLSDTLSAHYAAGYATGPSDWRALGAIEKAANIQKLCAQVPHASIVDIGAGEGAVLKRLARAGFGTTYNAVEISPGGVRVIRESQIKGLASADVFDGATMPYTDKSFDLAILSHVVEHLEHPRQLLAEAARVAHHVYVEVPLEQTMRMKADFKWTSTGHINFFSPKTIRRLVQTCGLTVIEQRTTLPSRAAHAHRHGFRGSLAYFMKKVGLRVAPRLAPTFFVYHSALLCRSET